MATQGGGARALIRPPRSNAGGVTRGQERATQVQAMNAARKPAPTREGKRPPIAGGTVIANPGTLAQNISRVMLPTSPQMQAFAVPAYIGERIRTFQGMVPSKGRSPYRRGVRGRPKG